MTRDNRQVTEEVSRSPWICAQIGSREHYAIPRALHERGRLQLLLTDFWATEKGLWRFLPAAQRKRIEERFHPALADARVIAPGDRRLLFDLKQKTLRNSSWESTLRRNEWFQDIMLQQFQGPARDILESNRPGTFFSYSYAARKMFHFFRFHGWRTILGQIDPGPREEEITARETDQETELSTSWERAPVRYWKLWKEECELADEIWVNSSWSGKALGGEGIPEEKIRVVPLVFSKSSNLSSKAKEYPTHFTQERPMRVLFLGRITLRKGAHLLLRAARQLRNEPIEFWMVGPAEIRVPNRFRADPRFRWTGPVSRGEATRFYQEADLFILPTLSDGFALTQLEAQARGLPVLASRYCGEVVRDGENGLLLDPLNEDTLVKRLRDCVKHPDKLAAFSRESRVAQKFEPSALATFMDKDANA